MYDSSSLKIRRIDKNPAFGITPCNAEQTFALDALTNKNIQLVTLGGKAGTGKTLLALAAALQRKKNYRQIFLARPVVPLSNKDIGFLPGDIQSKLDPYMQPLFDNLSVIKAHFGKSEPSRDDVNKLLLKNKLVISALAYIRGRSLVNIYFIVVNFGSGLNFCSSLISMILDIDMQTWKIQCANFRVCQFVSTMDGKDSVIYV